MEPFVYLKQAAALIGPDVTTLASCVLNDPRFAEWPASLNPKQHHHTRGGLLQHTYEVVSLCETARQKLIELRGYTIPWRTLFLAALCHDWGKLWDYRFEPASGSCSEGWVATNHKRTIHHINRSAIEWSVAVHETECCADIHDEVLHAILAHHGRREWGSPVAPKGRVALLLHQCDMMSARMDDADRLDLLS